MNERITFRRLGERDVSALSAIAGQTFFDTFTGTCTEEDMNGFLEKYYNKKSLAEEIESGIEYYFAENETGTIGYFSCKAEYPSFPELVNSSSIELKRFYVDKSQHGLGIARLMMQFFLDHAISQGYDAVFLGVWEFNYRAQKFYQKFDFKLTEHRHDFPIGNTPQTDVYMIRYLV